MKISEAPSGDKAKKQKNIAAQQKMEMNSEDPGNCCQAEFRLASRSLKNLAMKLTELPILRDKDSLESFQIFTKLFPKCILKRLAHRGSQ